MMTYAELKNCEERLEHSYRDVSPAGLHTPRTITTHVDEVGWQLWREQWLMLRNRAVSHEDALRRIENEIDRIEGRTPRWPVIPDPVPPPPPPPPVGRRGLVRAAGHALRDDDGVWFPIGCTMMWAVWAYRHDRNKLRRNLHWVKQVLGADYIRVLGCVGDPSRPDYWDGREVDWRWSDYPDLIAGLTDLAYDEFGLRVEWTLIGDGQVTIPRHADREQFVDLFARVMAPRAQKVMHFEIVNEYPLNGFDGQEDAVRALTRRLQDRTANLVASSTPLPPTAECLSRLYRDGIGTIYTAHFDRADNLVDGKKRHCRQPWESREWPDRPPVGSNNEPVGPGSSGSQTANPYDLVDAAIVTGLADMSCYVVHSDDGVRGKDDGRDELPEMENAAPIARGFQALRRYLPADIANWPSFNHHWAGHPFEGSFAVVGQQSHQIWPDGLDRHGVVRAFAAAYGKQFVCHLMGIRDHVDLRVPKAMQVDVLDVATGSQLQVVDLRAGQTLVVDDVESALIVGEWA